MKLLRASLLALVAAISAVAIPVARAQHSPLPAKLESRKPESDKPRSDKFDPRQLDRYVKTTMAQWDVPGLALAIVKDGRLVLARGYGVRELGKPDKIDADTLFGIASNSKAFTAAALGTLVRAGKLHWDDKLIDHVPDFRMQDPYVTSVLTVRDALSHRSGYCDPTLMWLLNDFDSAQIIHQLRFQPADYGLREHFCYNNTMYLVAGQIVHAITGRSWDTYVREQFLAPLDMNHTSSRMAVFQDSLDAAVPHGRVDGRIVPVERMKTDAMAPAGGIKSNVADMSHWLMMLLADGRYQGRRILDPAIIHTMETPQMLLPADSHTGTWARTQTPDSHFFAYGLGLFVQDYAGHPFIWHAGDISGMASAVGLLPDQHLGVVVLSNMDQNRAPEAVMMHVLATYLDQPQRDISGALKAWVEKQRAAGEKHDAELEATRDPDAQPSLALAAYTGTYHDDLDGDAHVTLTDGHLELAFGDPDFSARLVPWARDTFKASWRNRLYGDAWVNFDLDALGHVHALHVSGIGADFTRQHHNPDTRH